MDIWFVNTVAEYLKGKNRDEFLQSVDVLRSSRRAGAWVPPRGRQRADKGFKGLVSCRKLSEPNRPYIDDHRMVQNDVYRVLGFGVFISQDRLDQVTDADLEHIAPTVPADVAMAYLRLAAERRDLVNELDAARPLPRYTEVGLSEKVTATFRDVHPDLDLSTRRCPPIKFDEVLKRCYADWPKGTIFGATRFAHCDCQACGKSIPSGMVVPILVSTVDGGSTYDLHVGRDCARNIFGVKDEGLKR